MNAPSETLSRRKFLQTSSIAAAAAASGLAFPFVSARNVLGANQRLNIAGIGVGGKGAVDVGYCAGENIVALCDVDGAQAGETFKRFAYARRYRDFREMLEKEAQTIDAVTISTPDHTHAHAALQAIQAGKHIYLQKPLTHSVWEARVLTRAAREKGVVTQMGNQGHAHPGSRRLVELIRSGVLGEVQDVHVWTDRPIWPQGMESPPKETPPVPRTLDWDLWLGPAPMRPYHPAYLPFKWRGWWDFGCGALGDMGCHNLDLAFWSLNLRDPEWVDASATDHSIEAAPNASTITYQFPANADRAAVRLIWYDGGRKPDASLAGASELPGNGCIIIGTKDTLYVPHYWGAGSFKSGATMQDYHSVPVTLPRLPGAEQDNDRAHHLEWIAACKGEGKTLSNFDYAGPMTEAVLLGNVALRVGRRISWNSGELRVTNTPDAAPFVRREYRKGWDLKV